MLVQGPVSEAPGSSMIKAEAKGGSSIGGTRKEEGLGFNGSKGVCWIKEGKGILCKKSSSGKWDRLLSRWRTGLGVGKPRGGDRLALPFLSMPTYLPIGVPTQLR